MPFSRTRRRFLMGASFVPLGRRLFRASASHCAEDERAARPARHCVHSPDIPRLSLSDKSSLVTGVSAPRLLSFCQPGKNVVERARSFFGVHKVLEIADGTYPRLYHGTTLQGAKRINTAMIATAIPAMRRLNSMAVAPELSFKKRGASLLIEISISGQYARKFYTRQISLAI